MEIEPVMYVLMVRDMDRAIHFYTKVIEFGLRSQSPNWSELAFGDFTLAVHGGRIRWRNLFESPFRRQYSWAVPGSTTRIYDPNVENHG